MASELDYAWEQTKNAQRLLEDSRGNYNQIISSPSIIVSQCQQAIEASVKSMYYAVGEKPPTSHEISFENAYPLINADFPEGFYEEDKIPRAVFLTQFWHDFYLIAKYGDEYNIVPPDELISDKEAELAISHAEFCQRLARNLIHSARAQGLA